MTRVRSFVLTALLLTSALKAQPPTLGPLPLELVTLILTEYIPPSDRTTAKLVCVQWKEIIKNNPHRQVAVSLFNTLDSNPLSLNLDALDQRLAVLSNPNIIHIHIDGRNNLGAHSSQILEGLKQKKHIKLLSIDVEDSIIGGTWADPKLYAQLKQVEALSIQLHPQPLQLGYIGTYNPVQRWEWSHLRLLTHLKSLELKAPQDDGFGPQELDHAFICTQTQLKALRLDGTHISTRPYEYPRKCQHVTRLEGLFWEVPDSHWAFPSLEIAALSSFLDSYPALEFLSMRLEGPLSQSILDKMLKIKYVDLSQGFKFLLDPFPSSKTEAPTSQNKKQINCIADIHELCLINKNITAQEVDLLQLFFKKFKYLFLALKELKTLSLCDREDTSDSELAVYWEQFRADLSTPEDLKHRAHSDLTLLQICSKTLKEEELPNILNQLHIWFPRLETFTFHTLNFIDTQGQIFHNKKFVFTQNENRKLTHNPLSSYDPQNGTTR